MKLYIVRHGTTPWNAARRIQGATDTNLDEKGKAIARITGEALANAGIRFSRVFSSPLSRAVQTARLLAPEVEIQRDPRLRELRFGPFEGQFVEEMCRDENCPFRFFSPDPLEYDKEILPLEKTHPEDHYESLTSLCARAADFLEAVIEPLAAEVPMDTQVLISGHGALNRALLMHMRGGHDMAAFWGTGLQANCGICIAEVVPDLQGTVQYKIAEESRIYYDPELLRNLKSLL